MRWLTGRRRPERGAVAMVVAFWMVVVIGVSAIAIDMGSIYADQQQLQNGADAAALAYAESCMRGSCVDSADHYAKANMLTGRATGTIVSRTTGSVTVETDSVHQNWFAAALGIPTTPLSARSSAVFGYASGGPTFPLTFSWCAFYQATGGWDANGVPLGGSTQVVIHMIEQSCTPPAHNEVPGGFGWLSGANCSATVMAGNWVLTDPGNDGSTTCKDFDWTTLENKTVLVPIFQAFSGSGSNAQYQIKGLAAFTITGYCFSQKAQWNVNKCPSDKRIMGDFTNYVDMSGEYSVDSTATAFGAGTVKLVD